MSAPTLDIRGLTLSFQGYGARTEVLRGVSLSVQPEEKVALVGASGAGKSVTARLVLGLLQTQRGVHIGGALEFEGRDLAACTPAERRALRGTSMSMIFQDPVSALNPVYRIGEQFADVLRRRAPRISAAQAAATARAALAEVAIDAGERVLASYPFQLSGGMNQRVMIAMALANKPSLLIADEPGTALDVTVQAQTLNLMHALAGEHRAAVLLITHDLAVVREFADRVYVIHRGRIVEAGTTAQLFAAPRHPYTRALLAAVPRLTGGGIAAPGSGEDEFDAPAYSHPPPPAS